MENAPYRLVSDIMELRAYARAKQAIEEAKEPNDIPRSPSVDMVMEIEAEVLRDLKRKREEMKRNGRRLNRSGHQMK